MAIISSNKVKADDQHMQQETWRYDDDEIVKLYFRVGEITFKFQYLGNDDFSTSFSSTTHLFFSLFIFKGCGNYSQSCFPKKQVSPTPTYF